jgi:signal transduction histidine kinase
MTALPVELDPNLPPLLAPELPECEEPQPFEFASLGWTPLRLGLGFAWFAAVVALLAVGLGGWSLLDLSERRIRFVSAVTHELRTPMTTLRLYLDLLSSGMVNDPNQREEYLKTMNGESDRLNRLITNVLDFARLEKSRPTVEKRPVAIRPFLEQLLATWQERCLAAGKELTIDCQLPEDAHLETDGKLLEQILCNLIDNAQKYSREATDPKIVLRARPLNGRISFEVEDRGPGITRAERSSIFRAFRRGRHADVKAGGVGLGLALATRWASFINGRLSVDPGENGVGACFRLEV